MKTYEQIFDEVLEDDLHNVKPEGLEPVRVRVAKAYAKQWVKKALEETHETYVTATVEEYEKLIDAQ